MLRRVKATYAHYLETKQGPYEGFLEWYLRRQAGFWTKLVLAGLLWSVWIWLWFNPWAYLYLLRGLLLLAVLFPVLALLAYQRKD